MYYWIISASLTLGNKIISPKFRRNKSSSSAWRKPNKSRSSVLVTSQKFWENSAGKSSGPWTLFVPFGKPSFYFFLGIRCRKKGIFIIRNLSDVVYSGLIHREVAFFRGPKQTFVVICDISFELLMTTRELISFFQCLPFVTLWKFSIWISFQNKLGLRLLIPFEFLFPQKTCNLHIQLTFQFNLLRR